MLSPKRHWFWLFVEQHTRPGSDNSDSNMHVYCYKTIQPKKVVSPFLSSGQNCHSSNDNFGFNKFSKYFLKLLILQYSFEREFDKRIWEKSLPSFASVLF
ncbi:MAG: hypothetical protein EA391_06375 [Balneolaceae bacterium]|nr:MAG: hypothetical protein EA391_06375 [Balneolaceae bacterium]